MSKKLSFRTLVAVVCLSLTSFALSAQGYGVVLKTSFEEDDSQPFSSWTQENNADGLVWTVERGTLDHPNGVTDGTARAVFRNNTANQQSTGRRVKLVSPIVDISGLNLPILCFSHAQDQWVNDFDTLRVYYRMKSSDGWTMLKEYDRYYPRWEADTIALTVGVSKEFQVAFEATDNLGRGVVIDNVQIRSTPNCTEPYDLRTTAVSNDLLELAWQGSFDSDKFHLKVFSFPVAASDLETVEADVLDILLPQFTFFYEIKNLKAGTSYYWSVRAHCSGDSTDWAAPVMSRTSNVITPPYLQDFNLGELERPGYLDGWYYGSNIEGQEETLPFVNSDLIKIQWAKYSQDTTAALCFFATPNGSSGKLIPADKWMYTVTPQVMVEDMSVLQVSFWGYIPKYSGYPALEDRSLLVGLMTNPEDYSTFNPVAKVTLSEMGKFEEFIVSLVSVKEKIGEVGKYVALASASDVTNAFTIDNFRIDSIPPVQKARNLDIAVRGLDNVTVTWERYGASGGEVILSEKEVSDASVLGDDDIVARADYGKPFVGLNPWKVYYVYARNVDDKNGNGAWSNPVSFRTPMQISNTLPDSITFETGNVLSTGVMSVSDQGMIAMIQKASNLELNGSPKCLSPNVLDVNNSKEGFCLYAIFPEMVTDVAETRVSFYSSLRAKNGTNNKHGCFEVGIIEDINDVSTFEVIDTVLPDLRWDKYIIPFDKYTGKGKFFAIRVNWKKGEMNYTGPYALIDNLVFETVPECAEPLGIEVVPGEVTADIRWDDNGAEAWDVRISEKMLTAEELADEGTLYVLSKRVVKAEGSHLQATELATATTYYLYMRSVCAGGKESVWSPEVQFTTNCPAKATLPYIQNFDGYPLGDGKEFTVPCVYSAPTGTRGSACPKLSEDQKFNGNASLELRSSKSGWGYYQYFVLPEMAVDIHELSLIFRVYSGATIGSSFDVMLLNNRTDITDGDVIATLGVNIQNIWEEKVVTFTDYEGTGKYIAFRSADPENTVGGALYYIDSIVVDMKGCVKLTGLSVYDVNESNAELTWKDEGQQSSEIVVTSKSLSVAELDNAMKGQTVDGVLEAKTATEISRHNTADIFEANGTYYFYVRSRCADGNVGQWSDGCAIYTDCPPVKPAELDTVKFDDCGTGVGKYQQCWKVMNEKIDAHGDKEYIPYVTGTYKHSGSASMMLHTTPDYMPAIAAMPKLEFEGDDNISNYYVSFYGAATQAYSLKKYAHSVEVGVMMSRADYGSFVPIDTLYGYAEEQLYKVYFDTYIGDRDGNKGQYIAFRSLADKENYFFIDDVAVGRIEDCPIPSHVSVRNLTDQSASIYWKHGRAPFTVKLSTRSLSADELSGNDIEGVSKTYTSQEAKLVLNDLTSSMEYFFYIKSTCENGGGDSEWSMEYRFTTECSARYPVPFEDGFDFGTLTGKAIQPECWQFALLNQAEGLEYDYPSLVENGDGRALYMYAKNTGCHNYAITPYLDVEDISKLQVRFSMKGNGTAGQTLVVGIVDIAEDEKISHETVAGKSIFGCDTIRFTSGIYRDYTVRFDAYRGKAKRVVFLYNSGLNQSSMGGSDIYIDNIVVEEAPTCAMPEGLRATDITENSISVSFVEPYKVKAWEYAIGEIGFDINAATPKALSATEFDITGLTPATTYDIYVRSVIGTDKSQWVGPLTHSTLSTPVKDYDYTADFESDADNKQWIVAAGGQNDVWYIGSVAANGGTNGLYISNDNGTTNAYSEDKTSVSWAYRTIDLSVTGEYKFNFDWRCAGAAGDYMRVGLLPTDYYFEAGDMNLYGNLNHDPENKVMIDASEWISLGGLKLNNKGDEWSNAECDLIIDSDNKGIYNLIVLWVNDGKADGATLPAAAIDNIVVSRSECVVPVNFRLAAVSDRDALVEWEVLNQSATGAEVFITTDAAVTTPVDEAVKVATAKDHIQLSDLSAGTAYYVFARQICGSEGEKSKWSERFKFTTSCEAKAWKAGGMFYDFETAEGGMTLECFTNSGIQSGYKANSVVKDASSKLVSRHDAEGNGSRVLCLDHQGFYYNRYTGTTANTTGGYTTLPLVDADFDSLQVAFWIRPVAVNKWSGKFVTSGDNGDLLGDGYTRGVVVGVMGNPDDFSTFVAIDTVEYVVNDLSSSKYPADDSNKQEYWQKAVISLKGVKGRHIAFVNGDLSGGAKSNFLYIDDIAVEPQGACTTPTNLTFKNVTSRSAEISFAIIKGSEWEIEVADNDTMDSPVYAQTVTTNKDISVSDLKPGTVYYARVRQNCTGNEYSDWSAVMSFHTCFETPHNEDFSNVKNGTYSPDYWIRYYGATPTDFMAGNASILASTAYNNLTSWNHRKSTDRMSVDMGESCKAWLVSPVVYVPNDENIHLTFNMYLNDKTTGNAIADADKGKQDKKFMVFVSSDGGVTWNEKPEKVWGNTGFDEDYRLDNVSADGERVIISLSDYAGKAVSIAFYALSEAKNANYLLSVDNFHINSYLVENPTYSLCQTEDYFDEHFDVLGSDMIIGENKYEYTSVSYDAVPDTIFRLTLNVSPIEEQTIEKNICEGTVYTENGFSVSEAGTYSIKGKTAEGCASVKRLTLTVTPTIRVTVKDSICPDGEYVWNGTKYTEPGEYPYTTESTVTGCDSITTLVLSLRSQIVTNETRYLCYGEKIAEFGEYTDIEESGFFTASFPTASGCDSIVNLTVVALPYYPEIIEAVICDGDQYHGDAAFDGLSRENQYTAKLTSKVGGCDSTRTLNLLVIRDGEERTVKREISVLDLPYGFYGEEFGEQTEPGVYNRTVTVTADGGGCSATIHLELTVNDIDDGSGIKNVKEISTLVLAPNPVGAGESVYLSMELTAQEREDLVVEVYDSKGMLVERFIPTTEPIIISVSNTGLHVVRVIDGKGNVRQGKLIVK